MLHCSIGPGSRVFYFTTVTWMMWHWLVSGLAAGATLILYDGSPMRYRSSETTSEPTELAVPRLIDELQIEHFGTSAKYLSILEQKNVLPREHGCKMSTLKAIYNTASPLAPSTFRYVYQAFGPDINLGSITGVSLSRTTATRANFTRRLGHRHHLPFRRSLPTHARTRRRSTSPWTRHGHQGL